MKITPELLRATTGCTQERAERFAALLSEAFAAYGIDTPKRVAAFLAQVGHESGSLRYKAELWGPTEQQKKYEPPSDLARRLGNTGPGDGFRYRGRGLIQTTGRFNYAKLRDRLRERLPHVPDFELEPQWLEDDNWAVYSACDYWYSHGCNRLADLDNFEGLTRAINGGLNGYEDRKARWERAKAALASHELEQSMPESAGPEPTISVINEPAPVEPKMFFQAIAGALLPTIIESIPKLGRLFGSGSQVSERNIKVAEIVVDTIKSATGAINAQDAVERIKSDPAALKAATDAIEERWYTITQEAGGGGIDGAGKRDAVYQSPESRGFWHSPVFWVTVLLLPLVYSALYAVLFTSGFSDEIKAMVIGAVFGGLLTGGIQAFYYGTSASSQRKTEMLK